MHISQSGRSMVEILGVLAVIGVLSIGALMGFRYAMDKYKANEIVNEVRLRAVDVVRAAQQGPLPATTPFEYYEDCENAFNEWPTEISGGFEMNICPVQDEEGTDLAAAIVVKDVPQGVCERLTEMDPHEYMESFRYLTVNGARYRGDTALCQDDNTIVFVMFLEGEDAREGCAPDDTNCVDCTFDAECERNLCDCAYCDRETGTCVLEDNERGEPQVCNEGRCETTQECLSGFGFRTQNGVCVPCTDDGDYALDPSDEIFKIERDGVVLIEDQDTPSALCRACGGERRVYGNAGDANVRCATSCPLGIGYVPFDGISEENGQFATDEYLNKCILCTNTQDFPIVSNSDVAAATCRACGNYTYNRPTFSSYQGAIMCGVPCPEGTFKGTRKAEGNGHRSATCFSCDTEHAPLIIGDGTGSSGTIDHKAQCTACGRSVVNWDKGYSFCVDTNMCGNNEFISAPYLNNEIYIDTACNSCDTPQSIRIWKKTPHTQQDTQAFIDSCEACGNRQVVTDAEGHLWCAPMENACADDQFLDVNGVCQSCSDVWAHQILSDQVSGCTTKCDGKTVVNEKVNKQRRIVISSPASISYCMPKCGDNQIQDKSGKCYDCDTDTSISVGSWKILREECLLCQKTNADGTKENTRLVSNKSTCVKIPTCETSEFVSGAGTCVSCATPNVVNMFTIKNREQICTSCPKNVSATNKGRTYYNIPGLTSECILINPGVSGSCNSLGDFEGNNPYPAGDGLFFRASDTGKCYPCNSSEDVEVYGHKAQCGSCGEGVRVLNGRQCSLNRTCSEGASFWNKELGRCMLCAKATGNLYETTYEKRGLCAGCGLRAMTVEEMVNEEVTKKYYCTQRCVAGQWQDADGNCIACDSDSASGNYIGADSDSKALCTACKRTITEDHNGDLMCDKS